MGKPRMIMYQYQSARTRKASISAAAAKTMGMKLKQLNPIPPKAAPPEMACAYCVSMVSNAMVVVLMGVSGAGKTTVGRKLAAELGWSFYEGDDFHSAASVEKMSRGIALTDEDRRPWLAALRALIERCLEKKENAVLACSALKQAYRRVLRGEDAEVVFVYLEAPPELLAAKRDLLPSQLATLEEPRDAVVVDASAPPGEIAGVIRERLGI